LADATGSGFLAGARHALILSPTVGPDCDGNGTSDYLDVITGASPDENHNLIPDACEPPIQNGGFEQPTVPGSNITISAGSNVVAPWTVAGGGLDLVHTLWDPAEGLNSISLNWVGPSTITQTVSTTPGTTYSLGFAMAAEIFGGPPVRQIDVLWNGVLVDTVSFNYTGQGPNSMGWEDHQYTLVGTGSDVLSFVSLTSGPYGPALDNVTLFSSPSTYCTAGTSASGCQAMLSASGSASATATSGFDLMASGVEGLKNGIFFFGTNGRQANPWGNGTSVQCVVPPVRRAGLLTGSGTVGMCDGSFSQDLNALWCPTCPKPQKNPGVGAIVQAQLWYRDPFNTSNQTTSLSDAVEFCVGPR
jgi:choice-of-anchor C domain-containing protein